MALSCIISEIDIGRKLLFYYLCILRPCLVRCLVSGKLISIPDAKRLYEIPTESPPTRALNTAVVYKFRDLRPVSGYMWETTQLKTGHVLWKSYAV